MTAEIICLPARRAAPTSAAAPAARGPAEIAVLPLPASRALAVTSPPLPAADNAMAATVALVAVCRDLTVQLDRIGQRTEALRDRMDALEAGGQGVAGGGEIIMAALHRPAAGAPDLAGNAHV